MRARSPQAAIDRPKRGGFTVIEVVVVLAVVGILGALLLAGIQRARESARRLQCMGNLRQIGLALSSYVSSHAAYPLGSNGNGYSFHSMILPYLDQSTIYHGLNFDVSARDEVSIGVNMTAFNMKIGALVCPSDVVPDTHSPGTSYPGNRGFDQRIFIDNGIFVVHPRAPVTPQAIRDGSSATLAVSEWVRGPVVLQRRDGLGSVFELEGDLAGPAKLEHFALACQKIDVGGSQVVVNDKGYTWILGGYYHSLYNHVLGIGDPSCINKGFVQEGAYSASSNHPSGCNTLFADGHVSFTVSSLPLSLWRALGTRDGAETSTQLD